MGELEECSGVAYQDQDSYQTISLLYVQDFVLVPGQILPLMFTRPNEASMIRQIVGQPNKTLGILIQKYVNLSVQGLKTSITADSATVSGYKASSVLCQRSTVKFCLSYLYSNCKKQPYWI